MFLKLDTFISTRNYHNECLLHCCTFDLDSVKKQDPDFGCGQIQPQTGSQTLAASPWAGGLSILQNGDSGWLWPVTVRAEWDSVYKGSRAWCVLQTLAVFSGQLSGSVWRLTVGYYCAAGRGVSARVTWQIKVGTLTLKDKTALCVCFNVDNFRKKKFLRSNFAVRRFIFWL